MRTDIEGMSLLETFLLKMVLLANRKGKIMFPMWRELHVRSSGYSRPEPPTELFFKPTELRIFP